MRELTIPEDAEGDEDATEMARVWIAHDSLHVSLLLGMWGDPDESDVDEREAWGNLLADVTRHIATGLSQSHGWDAKDTVASIKDAFLENIALQERLLDGERSHS